MTITQPVKVPSCWRKLVSMEFPEDLKGVTSEKSLRGVADPRPHYDDARVIEGEFQTAPGCCFRLELCSGQSNYYGGLAIWTKNRVLYESEPLENFDSLEVNGKDGNTYVLIPEWVKTLD